MFSLAFGGEATSADGYGDIPSEYLDALRESFEGNALAGNQHIHMVAYFNDQPVGCGSVHVGDGYGGLYNVGTLPEYRKKGIGAAY